MGLQLFKPRGATKNNFSKYEKDLYIALETLKAYCKRGEIKDKCYVVQSNLPVYRKAFNLSYSLVRFYTKYREESKEMMFKRNFLLSKTRGMFSNQEVIHNALHDTYLINCKQLDELPSLYFNMFHLNKSFKEELPKEIMNEEEKEVGK